MESRQTENKISHHFKLKVDRPNSNLVSSTTELTGLVPGVGVLLFEADSESDSDSEGLRLHIPECMNSRFEQFVQFALIALYSVRRIRTSPTK